MKKHLLLILDGYGIAADPTVSAIDHAKQPYLDSLFETYPHGTLDASGLAVGLPEGQMGNSEVGHTNLGAGRVVYQEMTRIDKAIAEGDFFENDALLEAVSTAKTRNARLHVLGLLSDGGVHSHQDHLHALLKMCGEGGLEKDQVQVHAFMDGRDTSPNGGLEYVRRLEKETQKVGCGRIASVVGRYWAMDRDNRWERIEKAYRLLVHGEGAVFESAEEAISSSYADGVTDEFIEPARIGPMGASRIQSGDVIVFVNYRADRARQITRALNDESFAGFEREQLGRLHYVTFTPYENAFTFPVAFPKLNLTETLGEVVSSAGFRQLRAAETEKYPHVTYFFNGGREIPFEGEDRILVASPKVATYDLQPEMSAPELADKVSTAMRENDYAFVVLNFANPDMVGHTGVFEAAVSAIEAVDKAAKTVIESALRAGYSVNVIADHGNADCMRNPDGSPHTAHTTVPVPHIIIKEGFSGAVRHGKLGDVAPTILDMLDIQKPDSMTGQSLI
ncbi:MAG: 2,3-bisphosphoglycerate-independent phosphoglycerate mutase [Bacteroidetes Order II. Incertae sedis bacterium]|jgi:2,3-bisphosphoglycerate-independent phosphoglycerate mutase|nr:2,3-bisphosphoglycerate-independent phosphoglycerate mutase [Bacteroidetes Order II. bacterium]